MSSKMIYALPDNDFNKTSNFYAQQNITDISEYSKFLPKKPKTADSDSFAKELKSYESEMQTYFTFYSTYLYSICTHGGGITNKCKDIYYKLMDDYKSYQKYISKAKRNYEHTMLTINSSGQVREYGNMSPSNPNYKIYDDDIATEKETENKVYDNEPTQNVYEDGFSKNFREKMKEVKRYLRKEKRKSKVKKLTKNQKKKLKRKLKSSQEGKEVCVINSRDYSDEYNFDPQFTIQQFFQEYSRTGKWSWTIWRNSIAKIQQNFPDWFEVFSQYSSGMGINWNNMFMSDVHAIDMTNVRIDVDNLDGPDIENIDYFNESTKQGKSVIFTDEVTAPESNELSISDLYCNACQQEFKSKRAFHVHLRGVKHIQNEIKHVSKQKPEIFLEEINKENASIMNDITKEDKHINWLLNNEEISKEAGTYTCQICNVSCSSQKDFKTHLNGDKHHNIAKPLLMITAPISPETPKLAIESKSVCKTIRKPVARIQIFLNQCTMPLIGLNCINEYQKLDTLLECLYVCELCNCKLDRKTVIPHAISFEHRETYLKENYCDLYALIEQDPSSKPVRTKRLDVFSEQIEIFEGRKNVNIMIEKKCDSVSESTESTEHQTDHFSVSYDSTVDLRKRKNELENLEIKKKKPNEINEGETSVDIDEEEEDKEDGEIESSDEDFPSGELSLKNIVTVTTVKQDPKPDDLIAELEAGEIENEINESFNDSESGECPEPPCSDEQDKIVFDKSEFDNYEPVFTNERPTAKNKDIVRDNGRIEIIRQSTESKKMKLKEVTEDILSHFKQEAIWALNRSKQNSTPQSKTRSLLLPQSKLPVGPNYPGVSVLKNRHANSKPETNYANSNDDCILTPEIEFKNIIDKIEFITGHELGSNRVEGKCNLNDKNLLHDVQNMLVNRSANDKLNEVVRQELLFSNADSASELCSSTNGSRKHILSNPLNIQMLNETVEMLKNMPDISFYHQSSDGGPTQPETLSNRHSNDQAISITRTAHFDALKMGKKMSKQSEFLGLDQAPPPTSFPKVISDQHYYERPMYNILPNSMPMILPYFTPGMIEHHPSAFSNYNSTFMYQYPFLTHNLNNNGSRPQSDISNSRNRTSI